MATGKKRKRRTDWRPSRSASDTPYQVKRLAVNGDQATVVRPPQVVPAALTLLAAVIAAIGSYPLLSLLLDYPVDPRLATLLGFMVLLALAFLICGLFLLGYGVAISVDRQDRTVSETLCWFGLPFRRKLRVKLTGETVFFEREVVTHRRNLLKATVEWFKVSAKTEFGEVTFATSKQFLNCRTIAEDLAGFLDFDVYDATASNPRVRKRGDLDKSIGQLALAEKKEVAWPETACPSSVKLCRKTIDDHDGICLCYAPNKLGLSCSFVAAVLLMGVLGGEYWVYKQDYLGLSVVLSSVLGILATYMAIVYALGLSAVGMQLSKAHTLIVLNGRILCESSLPGGIWTRKWTIDMRAVEEIRCEETTLLFVTDNEIIGCLQCRSTEELAYFQQMLNYVLVNGVNAALNQVQHMA